jgi:hypothetical protein
VAVSVVFSIATKRMVVVLFSQWFIVCKRDESVDEIDFQRCPVRTFRFALVVTFESTRVFNRPHSSLS